MRLQHQNRNYFLADVKDLERFKPVLGAALEALAAALDELFAPLAEVPFTCPTDRLLLLPELPLEFFRAVDVDEEAW